MTRTPPHFTIRAADRPGDLGWVVMAHGEVYAEQFAWTTDVEVLLAGRIPPERSPRAPRR